MWWTIRQPLQSESLQVYENNKNVHKISEKLHQKHKQYNYNEYVQKKTGDELKEIGIMCEYKATYTLRSQYFKYI